ncbi:hypothetical protein G4X40_07840 [Rhodococcus sp. D2-41]|uniref:hypothetical protein n=1 Tax=Speluncibacter jeojiensis TaxID=2710754 RepID=UPI0024103C22|nr:hypothetical protein [Rhodococcus sp. D2-41]MDG3010059.1 hypothetical protein [Rhodococcus sp. D2-41]
MRAWKTTSGVLLVGALVALPVQVASADPVATPAPRAALATDSNNRIAVAVEGGSLRMVDGALSVVGADGLVDSALPTTVTDDRGRTAKVSYEVVGANRAIVTADAPVIPVAASVGPGLHRSGLDLIGYGECVVSGAVKQATAAALQGGLKGAAAGGLAGATAGGLLGGGVTIWSGPGAILGAALAAAPGILSGAATAAAAGAVAGATSTILTDGVKSLFSCTPALFPQPAAPAPTAQPQVSPAA